MKLDSTPLLYKKYSRILFLIIIFNSLAASAYCQISDTCVLDSVFITTNSEEIRSLINTSDLTLAQKKIQSIRQMLDNCHIKESDFRALLYHLEALINTNNNELELAINAWTSAIALLETSTLPNKTQLSRYSTNLGSIYYYLQDLENALKYMELGLEYSIQVHGENSVENLDFTFNLSQVYAEIGKYKEAKELHLEMIKTLRDQPDLEIIKLVDSYIALARLSNELGEFKNAISYHNKALSWIEELPTPDNEALGILYDTNGFTYLGLSQLDFALSNFKKAEEYFTKQFGDKHNYVSSVLNNQGMVYGQLGKFESAISAYNKSLEIDKIIFGDFHPRTAATFNNIGEIYTHKGEHSKALEYFEAARDLFRSNSDLLEKELSFVERNIILSKISVGESNDITTDLEHLIENRKKELHAKHPDILSLSLSLGTEYIRIGENKKAIDLFSQTLQILNTNESKDSTLLRHAYFHFGQALVNDGQIEQGINSIKKSIDILSLAHSASHPDLILYNRALGNIYDSQDDYSSANKYFQKSLSFYNDKKRDVQLYSLPQYILTLESIGKAHRKHFKQSKSPRYLEESKLVFHQAKSLIDTMYKYVNNGSKLDVASLGGNIFFSGSLTSLEKFIATDSTEYLADLFDFSERSKSAVLLDSYRKSGAQYHANDSNKGYIQNIELKDELNFYEKKLYNAQSNNTENKILLELKEKIFQLKQKLNASKLNSYNELKPTSLEAIYNFLSPDQTLLEYSISDSLGIILLINLDTVIQKKIKFNSPLNEAVEAIRSGISNSHLYASLNSTSISTNVRKYITNAHHLYQLLIAPVEEYLNSNVIIVPDNELGYLPFEVLLSDIPVELLSFHNYPYFINNHSISYNYSSTLLLEMKNKVHLEKAKNKALVIAPFTTEDTQEIIGNIDSTQIIQVRGDTLSPLRYSVEEAANVTKIINGESWYGQSATVQEFKDQAHNYSILHLSTHGIADDRVGDYAYLALSDSNSSNAYEKLYVRDIYNIRLNTDLVTLSACRTGYGKLAKGEGIISLARAFASAGAKSIITTHWNVDDKSTAHIITSFYRYLVKGQTKDVALRNAKIDFLKENKSLKAHPFYWGGIFAIGDMSPIDY